MRVFNSSTYAQYKNSLFYGTLAARWNQIPSSAMIAGLGYVFYQCNFSCWFACKLYQFALSFQIEF